MDQTAIKAGSPLGAGPHPATASQPRTQAKEKSELYRVLETVASLRITVVLFVLSFFLVFFGTWAQKEAGIWTVVNDYFRSAFVWIPLRTLTMYYFSYTEGETVFYLPNGAIPYPGGWLLGTLLLINLLAAHAVRFKLSWKRAGILLIHGGIILMMLGEFITGVYQVERRMTIMEGNTGDHLDHERSTELAIVDRSGPTVDKEILIPQALLVKGGPMPNDALPFDVVVDRYMSNSVIHKARVGAKNPATVGIGLVQVAKEKPETVGVDQEQKVEMQSAYVTLKEKGTGKSLGTYLVSTWFAFLQRPMEEVTVDGKKYGIALRSQREYQTFQIQLLEFRHDKYVGTDTPKNYSSKIRLIDPDNKEDREVLISMNNPLRYRGETFYQSSLHPLAKGTVLQVVRNPGWLLPYFSCFFVTLGMMVHFGLHLTEFLRRRFAV